MAVAVLVARTNTPVADAPRGGATAPVYSAVIDTDPVAVAAGTETVMYTDVARFRTDLTEHAAPVAQTVVPKVILTSEGAETEGKFSIQIETVCPSLLRMHDAQSST